MKFDLTQHKVGFCVFFFSKKDVKTCIWLSYLKGQRSACQLDLWYLSFHLSTSAHCELI